MVTHNTVTQGVSQSSIEAKQNAKGEYAVAAKVYQNNEGTLDIVEEMLNMVRRGEEGLTKLGRRIAGS
tara:strand:- start:3415 stop:3618 length:204 start_codon:yes stop_codon:yes gene_type:complete